MSELIRILSSALQLSIVYWIVNLGFVYLYRTTGVLNFAQGQMLMVGAFVLILVIDKMHLPLAPALLVVLVASALFGTVIFLLSMRYLRGANAYAQVIGTFMLSIVLTQVVGLIWGINSYVLPVPKLGLVRLGGANVPVIALVSAAVLLVLIGVTEYLVTNARWGIAMRAAASNGALAMYYGIRNIRLGTAAWAAAFVCATLGGLVYAENAPIVYGMASVGFVAFPAAVIGGMDSVPGAILGGCLVAVIQSVAGFYFGGSLAEAASFVLVILVLISRPFGLLGKPRSVRL